MVTGIIKIVAQAQFSCLYPTWSIKELKGAVCQHGLGQIFTQKIY